MSVDMVLETLKVDFKPLYQSIHIYTALDSLDELRKSYQADRKVRSSKGIFNCIPYSPFKRPNLISYSPSPFNCHPWFR